MNKLLKACEKSKKLKKNWVFLVSYTSQLLEKLDERAYTKVEYMSRFDVMGETQFILLFSLSK